MMKQEFKILSLLVLLVVTSVASFGQIGGNLSPLKYSSHTYSVTMGDVSFTPNWGLYPDGTTASQIEEGTATALTPGVDYTVLVVPAAEKVNALKAYWKIQFNLNVIENTTYVIGYKETTADANKCLTAVVQSVFVYPAFDVDVELNAGYASADCGDQSGDPKGPSVDLAKLQTTIQYRVYMVYPDAGSGYLNVAGKSWQFNFDINVVGSGATVGKDATIASITAAAADMSPTSENFTVTGTPSSYSGSLSVEPTTVREVIFTVTYNEVLGIEQTVTFEISSIYGAYMEPDVDIADNIADGGNRVTHTIYAMPDVGAITAWGL